MRTAKAQIDSGSAPPKAFELTGTQTYQSNLSQPVRTTGNPFVDTGLAVLANRAHLDSIDELELRHLFEVHKDGGWLADTNIKLKSFTMFFTTNSLLTQPSMKDSKKRMEQYSAVVTALLNSIGKETVPRVCESCGNKRSLDFETVVSSALGYSRSRAQEHFVGRDWFPLAGSFGSDAQALPGASRAPALCALCLFAVQYAPLLSVLYNGKLVLYTSTDEVFWYQLVSGFCETIEKRIRGGNYETYGKKEGSAVIVDGLFRALKNLEDKKKRGDVSPDTVVDIWQFSNAQSQDCRIQQVPNSALRFLSSVSRAGLIEEALGLIRHESKRANQSFLQCVLERRDYSPLYPYKKHRGASPELFVLYQTKVTKRKYRSLVTAFKIASSFSENYGGNFEGFRREFGTRARRFAPIKKEIVRLVESRAITPSDYYDLFPLKAEDSTRTEYWGWDIIKYYLQHHEVKDRPVESPESVAPTGSLEFVYYASAIYNEMIERLDFDGFQSKIMSRLERGDIGLPWLQSRFQELATRFTGFTYADWNYLFVDAEGKTIFFEPLFRMRLLWARSLSDKMPGIVLPEHLDAETLDGMEATNGLPQWLQSSLREYFEWYVDNRGIRRFEHLLEGIRSSGIGLGWIRRMLAKHAGSFKAREWEEFLTDEEVSGRSQGKFKIGLLLANFYRLQSHS